MKAWPVWASSRYVWAVAAAIAVFPLSHYDLISTLRFTSVISLVGSVYVAVDITVKYCTTSPSNLPVTVAGSFYGQMSCVPIVLFAFTCQVNICEIYKVGGRQDLRGREKRGVAWVVTTLSVSFLLYTMVGLFGYLAYPEVGNNVLTEGSVDDGSSVTV